MDTVASRTCNTLCQTEADWSWQRTGVGNANLAWPGLVVVTHGLGIIVHELPRCFQLCLLFIVDRDHWQFLRFHIGRQLDHLPPAINRGN
jgi:hypothetical protein